MSGSPMLEAGLLDRLRDARAAGNLVLFCGAGVSIPSGLPSAAALMASAATAFLGPLLDDVGVPDVREIRPEVFFQLVATEAPEPLVEFLSSTLGGGVPNANHLFAAELLRDGIPVVTTNFDLLIEGACNHLGFQPRVVVDEDDTDRAVLYKIHGTVDRRTSLMVTIDDSYRGLSPAKSRRLRLLLRGATLLVLGYSGLDQLDIMPVLREGEHDTIIWIDHSARPSAVHELPHERVVRELPRLQFFSSDTLRLTRALLQTHDLPLRPRQAPFITTAVPLATSARIAARLLVRATRSADLDRMLDRHRLRGDLWLDWRSFRLRSGNLSKEARSRELAGLRARTSVLPPHERRPYLADIAATIEPAELRAFAEQVVAEATASGDPVAYMALVECAFQLVLHRDWNEADRLLDLVRKYITTRPEALLAARTAIVSSGSITSRGDDDDPPPELLEQAQRELTAALALVGEEIYNDRFYAAQIAHNLAIVRRMQKQYDEAARLYDRAADYFQPISLAHFVQVLANRAIVFLASGDYGEALRSARRATGQRRYHRIASQEGQLERTRGRAWWGLALNETDPVRRRRKLWLAEALLTRAEQIFLAEQNEGELTDTRNRLKDLRADREPI